jgi:hypothetical protein
MISDQFGDYKTYQYPVPMVLTSSVDGPLHVGRDSDATFKMDGTGPAPDLVK